MQVELPEKRYYSIGEIAKAFSVNTSLIRFWEKEFDILKPKKNAKGNRMFTPEDLKNLKLIFHLVKERGFTLEGAKEHLKNAQKKPMDTLDIISKLEGIKINNFIGTYLLGPLLILNPLFTKPPAPFEPANKPAAPYFATLLKSPDTKPAATPIVNPAAPPRPLAIPLKFL